MFFSPCTFLHRKHPKYVNGYIFKVGNAHHVHQLSGASLPRAIRQSLLSNPVVTNLKVKEICGCFSSRGCILVRMNIIKNCWRQSQFEGSLEDSLPFTSFIKRLCIKCIIHVLQSPKVQFSKKKLTAFTRCKMWGREADYSAYMEKL